jgi:predicted hexulose-6-phosphate isomerase
MKSYQLGLYEKALPNSLSMLEKLTLLKKVGFDYLELSSDESQEKLDRLFDDKQIQDIKYAIEKSKVKILSMCLSGSRKYCLGSKDEQTRTKGIELIIRAIDVSVELGIRHIQLAGYDVYYEDGDETTKEYFVTNLKKVVEYAAIKGVLLGFETMETPFMDTVTKAMHYVDIVNSPYLGVYPDAGNLTNASLVYKSNLEKDIRSGTGHTISFHLKETLPNVYRNMTFGSGHTDYEKILKILLDLNVRHFVAECWCLDEINYLKDVEHAYKFLTKHIERIYHHV